MADDKSALRRPCNVYCEAQYGVSASTVEQATGEVVATDRTAFPTEAIDSDAGSADAGDVVPRICWYSRFLAACHRRYGVGGAAFVTACNPRSRTDLSDAENGHRQAVLLSELQRRGLRWMPCENRDASGQWRARSVPVLGISRDDTLILAAQAEQYPVAYAGDDGVPRLLACDFMAPV